MWQVLLLTGPPPTTGNCGEGPSTRSEAAPYQLQLERHGASEPLLSDHLHWHNTWDQGMGLAQVLVGKTDKGEVARVAKSHVAGLLGMET